MNNISYYKLLLSKFAERKLFRISGKSVKRHNCSLFLFWRNFPVKVVPEYYFSSYVTLFNYANTITGTYKKRKEVFIMRELLLSQGSRIRGYKKIRKLQLLIPFVLILFTSTATAQWNTQSPLPTHLDIRGIAAPTTERVFIATDDNSFDDGGALFESTDGGITWVQRNIPSSLGNPLN